MNSPEVMKHFVEFASTNPEIYSSENETTKQVLWGKLAVSLRNLTGEPFRPDHLKKEWRGLQLKSLTAMKDLGIVDDVDESRLDDKGTVEKVIKYLKNIAAHFLQGNVSTAKKKEPQYANSDATRKADDAEIQSFMDDYIENNPILSSPSVDTQVISLKKELWGDMMSIVNTKFGTHFDMIEIRSNSNEEELHIGESWKAPKGDGQVGFEEESHIQLPDMDVEDHLEVVLNEPSIVHSYAKAQAPLSKKRKTVPVTPDLPKKIKVQKPQEIRASENSPLPDIEVEHSNGIQEEKLKELMTVFETERILNESLFSLEQEKIKQRLHRLKETKTKLAMKMELFEKYKTSEEMKNRIRVLEDKSDALERGKENDGVQKKVEREKEKEAQNQVEKKKRAQNKETENQKNKLERKRKELERERESKSKLDKEKEQKETQSKEMKEDLERGREKEAQKKKSDQNTGNEAHIKVVEFKREKDDVNEELKLEREEETANEELELESAKERVNEGLEREAQNKEIKRERDEEAQDRETVTQNEVLESENKELEPTKENIVQVLGKKLLTEKC